ncbi:RING finger protein 150-like isoform X2 [Ruditapes philippinarum]|uniref:RING finger protein 150-like isoform X2 n=1 Tax=Ruditapes philippinarum TaxID=129788 RepID=UPI00295AF8C4|nr:RING finger protein 150-like isoform X2 [Ruditapes philippinarum]
MEIFTHTRIISTRWRSKMDVCIFYAYLYVLFTSPFVICSHEQDKDKLTEARISLSYIDVNGINKEVEFNRVDFGTGNYGKNARINSSPIKGQLVQVQTLYNKSELGCSELDPAIIPKDEPWIALVKRGTCNFNEKVYFARDAAAVIVYDNTSVEDTPIQMDLKGARDVQDIVAILISFEKGKKLVDMLKSHNVNITITHMPKKDDPPDSPGQLNNTSVLFVSISFIVLIIISLAWLVFYYIQRCRYTNAKERLSRRLANAAKKAIAKIPQRTIKAGDKELEAEADQCAVCIEPYKWNDVIRVLPCKHVFHKSCVDPWLLDQRNCPMCKMDILRAFGMHLNDSQESVPQDAESGLMSSTGAADDTEHLSNSEEPGAVGGVKIVLYQHPVRYCDGGSSQFQESVYSSDGSLDLQSSPVAQCHVECAGRAIVEHNRNSELSPEEEPCLARSGSIDSVHSFDDDLNLLESQSLMTRKSSREGASVTSMGSKSLRRGSESSSISLSMKEKM